MVWTLGKSLGRVTNNSEYVRVILLSLALAVLFQIPITAYYSSKCYSPFVGQDGQQEAVAPYLEHEGHKLHTEFPKQENVAIQQRTFQPTSTPHHAFVKFSSYRLSLKTIFVVGISSVVVRQWDKFNVVHTCEWHPSNGSEPKMVYMDPQDFIATNASMIYVQFDENGMTYVPSIVNCTFNQDVGADGKGGLLVIRVSLTYHRYSSNVPTIVMDEQSGDIAILPDPSKEKPYKYAYCGPPMHGHVKADWVKSWLIYHNHVLDGEAFYFFYNVGGLKDEDRVLFKNFIDAGLLNITDLTNPELQTDYPMWYFHQLLYINDCLQRARFLADYVFFFDFDEFLQVRPPETIKSLLDKHKELPWITFGNIPADFHHCRASSTIKVEDPVERMIWRDKLPECGHADEDSWTCVASVGRRKWVGNLQLLFAGGVHRAALPYDGGINLNASEARVIHFHGVLSPKNNVCTSEIPEKGYDTPMHMEQDDAISRVFAQAKKTPIKSKDVHKYVI